VFLAAGPRIFDVTAAGPVRIPKMGAMSAEPGWHGENELITEVDPTFDEVVLLDGIKSLKVITRYSNELARSSVVALDSALRDRLVFDVAAKLDTALIAGAETSGTPRGLLNYTGTQTMGAVGVPSVDKLYDTLGLALAANVNTDRLRWLMTSRDFIGLRKLKDSAGKYLVEADLSQGLTYRLLCAPVTITNRKPATGGAGSNLSTIVLADFSQIAVARDLAPSVVFLRERYADYDQQAIRVVAHYDAAPLNAEAVIRLTGVAPPAA
jgi:HK97 family phage major capsid protein